MDISVFEVIGPVMLGPSSSGTAGMARLGRVASRFVDGPIKSIDLRFHPRNEGYGGLRSHVALIGGIMGYEPYDPVIRDAMKLAEEKGIRCTGSWFENDLSVDGHTVGITVEQTDGSVRRILGASIGGGSIRISEIDGFKVELSNTEKHLFVWADRNVSEGLKELFPDLRFQTAEKENRYLFYAGTGAAQEAVDPEYAKKLDSVSRAALIDPFLSFGYVEHEPYFTTFEELVGLSEKTGEDLCELTIRYEMGRSGRSREAIWNQMKQNLEYMRECVNTGLTEEIHTLFGFDPGDDAKKMQAAYAEGVTLSGNTLPRAFAKALSVMEMGESMNRIVAAPTGGSAGIVPGCILTVQEDRGISDEELIKSLFIAGAVGICLYYHEVSFSGMGGGCQGEIGVSSAMAAAALAYLGGCSSEMIMHAMALAMKNILGLICDRIAGCSEIPCTTRNCIGVANAFAGCDMAISGIRSYVSPDQVAVALRSTQKLLPPSLRGGYGGLGCTKESRIARKIEAEVNRSLALK